MIIGVMAQDQPLTQWWSEHDFVLDGTPCTSYTNWPRDRLIHFYRKPNEIVEVKSRQGGMDLLRYGKSMLLSTSTVKDNDELVRGE